MQILNREELILVKGGAIKWAILAAIAAGITFLIGVVDGIVRPLKCN
jgi:lactobin A/cerein 7B family class IIb bacteriocin